MRHDSWKWATVLLAGVLSASAAVAQTATTTNGGAGSDVKQDEETLHRDRKDIRHDVRHRALFAAQLWTTVRNSCSRLELKWLIRPVTVCHYPA